MVFCSEQCLRRDPPEREELMAVTNIPECGCNYQKLWLFTYYFKH